ncbi:lysostaphin resistance A-like protein [Sphingomonas sp. MMS24-JH45]
MLSSPAAAARVCVPVTARTDGFAILVLGAGLACACVGGGVAIFGRWAATFEDWGAPTVEAAFTMLVFGLLAGVGIAAARFEGFRAGALGPNAAGWAAAGVAIGAGGMMAALADAHLAGVVVPGLGGDAGALSLLGGAGVVLAQSAGEEMFFRGWLQRSLARRWGWPAVVAAALAFSLAHLAGGARGPLTLVNLTLGGLVFGGWRCGPAGWRRRSPRIGGGTPPSNCCSGSIPIPASAASARWSTAILSAPPCGADRARDLTQDYR